MKVRTRSIIRLTPGGDRDEDRPFAAQLLAVALLLLVPAAAPAKTLDLPSLFEHVLPRVKDRTEVPLRLPQTYRSDSETNMASGSGRKKGNTLSVAAVRNRGGATACFIADFSAQRVRRMANSAIRHGAR